jgi:hypothetical protein
MNNFIIDLRMDERKTSPFSLGIVMPGNWLEHIAEGH